MRNDMTRREFLLWARDAYLSLATVSMSPDILLRDEALLKWRSLTLAERTAWKRIPENMTSILDNNKRSVIAYQFDDKETRVPNTKIRYPNNTCGEAFLTELGRMCRLWDTGKTGDTTINDIHSKLVGQNFTDYKGNTVPYIEYNDSMYLSSMPSAIEMLYPGLLAGTKWITEDCGTRNTLVWPLTAERLKMAREVCENGGVLMCWIQKYKGGHFVMVTDVKKNGTVLITDSYTNTATWTSLKSYMDNAPDGSNRRGLYGMLGLNLNMNVFK